MSFITLDKKNFVKNKIKGITKVYYNKNDSNTFLFDEFVDSKSLLFNKAEYVDKLQRVDFGLKKTDDVEYNRGIDGLKVLCDFVSSKEPEDGVIGTLNVNATILNLLKNNISTKLNIQTSEINNLIKSYNFKNEFHIEKLSANFILGDNFFQKKNIINREIYNNCYSSEEDNFIRNKNYGFCNYNTLNFMSVNKDKSSHDNCLIYPNNLIEENVNEYDFINKDIFYFQTRIINRNTDHLDSPRCIVHIPGLINVYATSHLRSQNYKILIVSGSKTKKSIDNIIDENNIVLSNDNSQIKDNLFITENIFEENKWYTLGIIFNKNRNKVELFVDGNFVQEADLEIISENSNINSYICIGNRPNYFNFSKNDFIESYNKNFDFYFNRECFLEKNIKVNNSEKLDFEFIDELDDIIESGDVALINNTNSEGFLGELSDIRFYSYGPSRSEIKSFHENYAKNLSEESLLSFYVPVFYIPDMISKKGILTAEGIEENISYHTYYNPYFVSYGGGFELSLENYVIEFIKNTKPNIVINGSIFENIVYEKTGEGLNYILNNHRQEVEKRFGEGERINKIYYDLYSNDYISNFNPNNDSKFDLYASNLIIKNHFILPNDNGIPNVYFDIIQEFCTKNNIQTKNTFKSFGSDLYNHLNSEDIFLDLDLYLSENINYDTVNGYNYNYNFLSFEIKDQNNDTEFQYTFTSDPFLDMSNIIYYRPDLNNSDDLFKYLEQTPPFNSEKNLAIPKFKKIRDTFIGSDCNPFCRNIFNTRNRLLSYNVFYTKEGFNITVQYNSYENMIGNFFKDYDNYFSSIIDIPVIYFNSKIQKKSFSIKDKKVSNIASELNINLKDDGYGILYRSDCLTKQAEWNYVGNILYTKGLAIVNNIVLNDLFDQELECSFESESVLHVQEVNIPLDVDEFNFSQNASYDNNLRKDEFAINSESKFIYITDVFLHDENFNIISKSKVVRPIPKSDDDRFLIKLKMDF